MIFRHSHNAALRCERRLAILERSETAKRCESLLNALLCGCMQRIDYLVIHVAEKPKNFTVHPLLIKNI